MKPSTRRSFVRSAAWSSAALCLAPALHAEPAYPSRPITLINPYAAGGPADTLARGVAHQLEQRLKQPIVVDSKAGGAATIGTGFVARARPDGYTLLLGTSAGHVVTPLMQRISYDGVADFAFIAAVANQPNVLVVHPSVGVSSLQELIALAKKEPGKLNYASAGTGGATHLGAESFLHRAQIRITHVPYGGAAPAVKDLLGGQVQVGMLNLAATQAFIAEGKLKALAYGGAKRSPLLPQVPTMAEAGLGGSEVSTWYTLAAPKGT
ncbi:MAG: tripartite tricarboxylate transporter substrate binding protein, partial [Pseudomonadota bacterium]